MRLGAFGAWIAAAALLPLPGLAATCPAYLQFLETHCAEFQSDILPADLPPARGNKFADRQDAAVLGMKIFYDNRFSRAGAGVSCASCHDPDHAFAENKPRSNTLREVARNAPDLIDAAWYRGGHFWDGKTDTLWSAPLFTFEQPDEMDSSRLHVVRVLGEIYKDRYEKIFGPLPDRGRIPEAGKPGSAEFESMTDEDRLAVNRAYANVGKALEAYIRKLAAGRAPFDDFMAGSESSLSPAARRGMVAFTKYGCQSCHSGPAFTDEKYHQLNLAVAAGHAPDPGREGGVRFARSWAFGSSGAFADPPVAEEAAADGAGFRTPSLRNVALTGPYGHDGSLETLDQAIDAHAQIQPVPTGQDKADIVEFLRALTGRPPQHPWNYWPGG
ncbi:MAG TPA: cytochrome c peroxidase [Alphaproteobacteria bacterium]|jgi:cytochrome c peroxidase|nr:cytochrome c peroxidase [Alphaproteobacteria bacterium]